MRNANSFSLGDLVMAAFDEAGQMTRDQRTTSVLAACAVRELLMKAGRSDLAAELTKKST